MKRYTDKEIKFRILKGKIINWINDTVGLIIYTIKNIIYLMLIGLVLFLIFFTIINYYMKTKVVHSESKNAMINTSIIQKY